MALSLDGELPGGPDAHLPLLFSGFDVALTGGESAPLGTRQFLAEIQRLGLLAL